MWKLFTRLSTHLLITLLTMPGSDFFSADGHDHLLCAILSHLDWRTVLAASATCRTLNRIVTTTSSLQVELRA
jgi:hypothetical protein